MNTCQPKDANSYYLAQMLDMYASSMSSWQMQMDALDTDKYLSDRNYPPISTLPPTCREVLAPILDLILNICHIDDYHAVDNIRALLAEG